MREIKVIQDAFIKSPDEKMVILDPGETVITKELLWDIEAYLKNREDITKNDQPNEAMQLLSRIMEGV